jgi:hypothetical protein
MTKRKLLKKLQQIFDLKESRKKANKDELKSILKKLKVKEKKIELKLMKELDSETKIKLQKELDIIYAQRKKGVNLLRELGID